VDTLSHDLRSAIQRAEQLSHQVAASQAQVAAVAKRTAAIDGGVAWVCDQLRAARDANGAQEQELLRVRHLYAEATQRLGDVGVELDAARKELGQARQHGEVASQELDATRSRVEAVSQELSETQQELSETQQELSETQQELSETQQQLSETQQRCEDLAQQVREHSALAAASKESLQEARHEYVGRV